MLFSFHNDDDDDVVPCAAVVGFCAGFGDVALGVALGDDSSSGLRSSTQHSKNRGPARTLLTGVTSTPLAGGVLALPLRLCWEGCAGIHGWGYFLFCAPMSVVLTTIEVGIGEVLVAVEANSVYFAGKKLEGN